MSTRCTVPVPMPNALPIFNMPVPPQRAGMDEFHRGGIRSKYAATARGHTGADAVAEQGGPTMLARIGIWSSGRGRGLKPRSRGLTLHSDFSACLPPLFMRPLVFHFLQRRVALHEIQHRIEGRRYRIRVHLIV